MKGSLLAAVAVLAGSASAHQHHRHAAAHNLFEKRDSYEVCTTFVTTIYGEITWVPTPAASTSTSAFVNTTTYALNTTTTQVPTTTAVPVPVTTTTTKTSSITSTVATVTETPCTVPTIAVQTCPTPGVYTFPATTVVITETTTVCGGSTTSVPAGTHTLGGVVTVVETATEVVCPYATTSTLPGGVVTSIIETTTYVCPSAGTYTIAPITTVVETDVIVVVPVVTSFVPATYTRPAVITTVTVTDVVVFCPFSIPAPAPAPAPVTTVVAAPAVVTTTPKKVAAPAAPATTTAAAPAKTTTATAKTASTVGKLGSSGNQWAITYTPYGESGSCKSAAAVLADITEIKAKGFQTVRVYSTDCDTLPSVGAACRAVGIKMIIGVFIGEVGCDNSNPDVQSQIAAIKAWGEWDLVELAVVGNEAGNNGYCTPAQLSSLIVEVKEIITAAGCDVPVTTTDTVNTWQNEEFAAAICSVIDVVACNAHGYFNAETAPTDAGKFVQGQLDIVKDICGKEGYVMETGWPSVCVPNGLATCSTEDQAAAIGAIQSVVGGKVVFFSYGDDSWKDDGSCGCEQHWGCGQLF